MPDTALAMFGSVKFWLLSYGPRILAAIAILVIGCWLAKFLAKLVTKALNKHGFDETLTGFLKGIIYYALLAAVVIAALGQLGINVTTFLALLGAAGLAVGLALKDSLSNFAAGVMLILMRFFKKGDYVTVAGVSGTVESVSIFHTVLVTPDNQVIVVPNGSILSGTITNVTAKDTRRMDLVIGVSYDDDLPTVRKVLAEVLAEEPRLLKDPAPTVAVSELADSSVNLVVRPWVATDDYWSVRFDLMEKIKMRLDDEGISIPFPQHDVHIASGDLAFELDDGEGGEDDAEEVKPSGKPFPNPYLTDAAPTPESVQELVVKDYKGMDLKELLAATPASLKGLSEGDAEKLQAAFNIKTLEDLATNKFFLMAQAIHAKAAK